MMCNRYQEHAVATLYVVAPARRRQVDQLLGLALPIAFRDDCLGSRLLEYSPKVWSYKVPTVPLSPNRNDE